MLRSNLHDGTSDDNFIRCQDALLSTCDPISGATPLELAIVAIAPDTVTAILEEAFSQKSTKDIDSEDQLCTLLQINALQLAVRIETRSSAGNHAAATITDCIISTVLGASIGPLERMADLSARVSLLRAVSDSIAKLRESQCNP